MRVALLVAAAENRVIGRDGRLPWHLPADLKRFKKLTLGQVVIMGRKTHESIVERLGRPLPRRRSLVLSRDPAYRAPGAEVASSLEQALELAAGAAPPETGTAKKSQRDVTPKGGKRKIFVIGGAAVFAEALSLADRLYLTRVHAEVEGDVLLPEIDMESWRLVSEDRRAADERHAHAFSFLIYDRRRPGDHA